MPLIEINKNPSRKQLLLFSGLLLPAFLGLLGLLVWHRWNWAHMAWAVWYAAAGLGLLGISFSRFARLVYLGWLYAVYPVGWMVSLTVLAIIYFAILTPIGLVLRFLNRQPLVLGFDRQVKSYWTARNQGVTVERYFRQF
jgi:TRAP-type C4-dicarboxylate transport system permease small subunit